MQRLNNSESPFKELLNAVCDVEYQENKDYCLKRWPSIKMTRRSLSRKAWIEKLH